MPHARNPTQVVSSSTVERVDTSQDPSALSVCCRPAPRLAFCAGSDRYHEYCEELIISSRGGGVEVEVEGGEEDVQM